MREWAQRCYWTLERIHTFGRRAATNPSLQWHLNEPRVLIQRAFLQGLCPVPRAAHSSISRGRKREGASKYIWPYTYRWWIMTSVSGKMIKCGCVWRSAFILTYTACSRVVQYKSSIALAHRTQIGPHAASVSTATLVWVFLWTVSLWTCESDRKSHENLSQVWVFLFSWS